MKLYDKYNLKPLHKLHLYDKMSIINENDYSYGGPNICSLDVGVFLTSGKSRNKNIIKIITLGENGDIPHVRIIKNDLIKTMNDQIILTGDETRAIVASSIIDKYNNKWLLCMDWGGNEEQTKLNNVCSL